MPGLWRLSVVTALALSAAACATMRVSSHVQQGLDFAQYRSYNWGLPDALPTGDPRLDANPFFQDHLQGAVERALAARGLQHVVLEAPDLLIHYHASVTERIDVNRIDLAHGYCYDDTCGTQVVTYEAGTLILDIVDGRTNRLIWRGWVQDGADKFLGSHDRMMKEITEAVSRIMARFPRAL